MLMIEWIAKYWLEVLFGIICSGLTFMVKRYIKLTRDSQVSIQKAHEKALFETIDTKFDEQKADMKAQLHSFNQRLEDQKIDMEAQMSSCYSNLLSVVDGRDQSLLNADKTIREDIQGLKNEFSSVRDGVLVIQGRAFKDDCHKLLEPDHIISLIEYENMLTEHAIYNALGGNHEGDALFHMVETKFKKDLVN